MTNTDLMFYWDLTQLVKEHTSLKAVQEFLHRNNLDFTINLFKTSKDEVLQLYNDNLCYTIIGGSSADKKEWRSNIHVGKLVHGLVHEGFYNLAIEVIHSDSLIQRPKMIYVGHSRGSVCVSIICWLRGATGYGFGTPKAFKKWVSIPTFTNVINWWDFVCRVVPFFKPVGKIVKMRFFRRPHTQYGRHLKKVKL